MTQTAEERSVTQVSPQWVSLLAGPVVWTVYFLVVYTLGEFGCRGGWLRGTLLGLPAPAVVISILTVVALAIGGWATWRSYRAWRSAAAEQQDWAADEDRGRFMLLVGWILGALFTYLILLTGLPAVVLPRCE